MVSPVFAWTAYCKYVTGCEVPFDDVHADDAKSATPCPEVEVSESPTAGFDTIVTVDAFPVFPSSPATAFTAKLVKELST